MSAPALPPTVREFDRIPTAEEFVTQIEQRNSPAVFRGCIKHWKAFADWNPSNGGLDYLQEKGGLSTIEAMLSQQAPVFCGDIRSHERVPLPFSTFIGYCKAVHDKNVDEDGQFDSKKRMLADTSTDQSDLHGQIYLAQVPIENAECAEKVQLECLKEDIVAPPFIGTKTLASINFWMNSTQSRSSTHYDPYHNLLCIISGCKQVVLWPPCMSPFLYPMPIYGEASNHSAVSLENPNFFTHPRAKHSDKFSQKVILHPGDALFIPEGWYHQVDSEALTIAVNFWWLSEIMVNLSEHMDSYYLRRVMKRLIDREMNGMLHLASAANDKLDINKKGQPNSCNAGLKLRQTSMLPELDSIAVSALQELISLVHDRVKPSQPVNSTAADDPDFHEKDESCKIMKEELYNLDDDQIAKVLWTLDPLCLQHIFVTMAHKFPRTLETLILHALSPVAAEVLTRKFEEMDQLITDEDRNQFYQKFYGVFENQFEAMDTLLNAKESFARQAFKNVLDQYVGVHFGGSSASVE